MFAPEFEKPSQLRKARRQIIVLPKVRLEQRRMIWHPINNFSSRQAVSAQLRNEIPIRHCLSKRLI
jgi:hypothetical protein